MGGGCYDYSDFSIVFACGRFIIGFNCSNSRCVCPIGSIDTDARADGFDISSLVFDTCTEREQ